MIVEGAIADFDYDVLIPRLNLRKGISHSITYLNERIPEVEINQADPKLLGELADTFGVDCS